MYSHVGDASCNEEVMGHIAPHSVCTEGCQQSHDTLLQQLFNIEEGTSYTKELIKTNTKVLAL